MNKEQKFLLAEFGLSMFAIACVVVIHYIGGSLFPLALFLAGMLFQNAYHYRVVMRPLVKQIGRYEAFDEVIKARNKK